MKRLHYGWVMVACAVGILATNGLTIYSVGVFLRPIAEEFDWERGAVSAAFSIGWLASGPLSLLTGQLSDRYGPRLLVTATGLVCAAALLLLSQIQALWQLYALYGVVLAAAGSGGSSQAGRSKWKASRLAIRPDPDARAAGRPRSRRD